ncbi:MAG: aminotransferase, partial [Promethearchaeota archaeon]
MKVPIVQLDLPDSVLDEAREQLASGMWIEGTPVRTLEEEFAEYTSAKYC